VGVMTYLPEERGSGPDASYMAFMRADCKSLARIVANSCGRRPSLTAVLIIHDIDVHICLPESTRLDPFPSQLRGEHS
jgi:hypothetical protein